MKRAFTAGDTSQITHVYLMDSSVSTGAGKTALTYSDITAYYVAAGGALTALTTETITTLGTWAVTGSDYLGVKLVHDTNAPGLYELHLPDNILAAPGSVVLHLRASGTVPCLAELQIGVPVTVQSVASGAIAGASLAADMDTYTARIEVIDDNANTTDRWGVVWMRNGMVLTEGLAGVDLQVVNLATGADLIAETAMSELGATHIWKYDAVTTERMANGAVYAAIATATVDESPQFTRTFTRFVGRDSAEA